MKNIKILLKMAPIILMIVCEIYLVAGKNITENTTIWIFAATLIYDAYDTFIDKKKISKNQKMSSIIGMIMCFGGMFIIEKKAVVFIFILKQLFDFAKGDSYFKSEIDNRTNNR